jgi:hypothetical protein
MMAQAVGIPVQQVQQRYEQVQPQGLFTAQEPIKTPELAYNPEPAPEPVYADPTYADPFYEDITSVAPAYVAPEPVYVAPEPVAQPILTQPVITPEPVVPPIVSLETPVITPEPQTTQEATTMAVTSKQIIDFLLANPNMTDAQIVGAMEQYGVSPAQMATAVGLKEGEVASRVAVTVPQGQTITLGDTIVQPVYQTTGSGMDQQVGGLENVITYKATDNKAGGAYTQYTSTGEVEKTGTQQEVKSGLKEFAIGAGLLLGLPTILNAGATTALTATELAQLDLATGGLGGTAGGASLVGGATVPTITSLTGGSGLLTGAAGGITAESVAAKLAADAATQFELLNAGAGAFTPTTLTPVNTTPLITPPPIVPPVVAPPVVAPPVVAPPVVAPPVVAPPVVAPPVVAPPVVAPPIIPPAVTAAATSLIPSAVKSLFTPTNIGNFVTSGAQTAAGLLQQQTSREAAQRAQQMIDAETAAAKQSAAFRPIGMTTRFGTSQFAVDPVTGQLTSAGYTLSPEAKNAQDRLVKLAESGLQQAEGAQAQFAPLQTGAQSLFGLGNQYLAQSPQDVAQNYLNQQMALLQPGRELELANLQNRLQQQGRGGLSVAQGGTLGATTPELQALFNARAQQEALLAANAQQYGQQNVLFGAGLLGQGSQAMGQYYGGQQAAYAPYTTALGQVQGLEQMAQQPFTMGAQLGQTASTAGARAGALGLEGANISQRLATGADATRNPYSSALSGAAANPLFGQLVGGLFGSQPATSGFSYGQYGTGIDPSTGEYFGSLYF